MWLLRPLKTLGRGSPRRFRRQLSGLMSLGPSPNNGEHTHPDTTDSSRNTSSGSNVDVTLSPGVSAFEPLPSLEPPLQDGSTLNILAGVALSPSSEPVQPKSFQPPRSFAERAAHPSNESSHHVPRIQTAHVLPMRQVAMSDSGDKDFDDCEPRDKITAGRPVKRRRGYEASSDPYLEAYNTWAHHPNQQMQMYESYDTPYAPAGANVVANHPDYRTGIVIQPHCGRPMPHFQDPRYAQQFPQPEQVHTAQYYPHEHTARQARQYQLEYQEPSRDRESAIHSFIPHPSEPGLYRIAPQTQCGRSYHNNPDVCLDRTRVHDQMQPIEVPAQRWSNDGKRVPPSSAFCVAMESSEEHPASKLIQPPPWPKIKPSASSLTKMIRYSCSYCGRVKASSSTGHDGRIRIRCECGGKYSDNLPRMHAMWTAVKEDQNDTTTAKFRLKRPCMPRADRLDALTSPCC